MACSEIEAELSPLHPKVLLLPNILANTPSVCSAGRQYFRHPYALFRLCLCTTRSARVRYSNACAPRASCCPS